MATLSDDELARVKAELCDSVLSVGAIPYFDIRSIYGIVQDSVTSSSVAATTSSTTVSSAGPTTITLASATGYAAGQRLVIDSDDARETVTLRSLSGSVASVVCTKTHSGTYPVEVESPLTIVRGLLSDLIALDQRERELLATAGLKRADEVEWFGEKDSPHTAIGRQRERLRARLATATGLSAIYNAGRAQTGGSSFEAY